MAALACMQLLMHAKYLSNIKFLSSARIRAQNCLSNASQIASQIDLMRTKNCLANCLADVLMVRSIARQDSGKNCLAAIFASRHQDVSYGPLGTQLLTLKPNYCNNWVSKVNFCNPSNPSCPVSGPEKSKIDFRKSIFAILQSKSPLSTPGRVRYWTRGGGFGVVRHWLLAAPKRVLHDYTSVKLTSPFSV